MDSNCSRSTRRRPPAWTRIVLIAAVGLLLRGATVWSQPQPARAERVLHAGAFAQDITPTEFPVSSNGSMSDKVARGAHDPLHARCLVLDDGRTQVAIVVCDSCMVPRAIIDEGRRLAEQATGIPADHILVSATHTHTGVTATGVFQSEPDPNYQRFLAERIAQGVQRAALNLRPAQIGWAVGHDATHVFNRRWHVRPGTKLDDPLGRGTDRVRMNPGFMNPDITEPAGPTDPQVSVLSVQSADDVPLALLANYSLHYVGGVQPLSADYFGAFAERIKQLLGAGSVDPPFVGIMSNGTSGDINSNNFRGPPPPRYAEYEKIRLVAESVAGAAYKACETIDHQSNISLATAQREIELGVRLPTPDEVAHARQLLDQAGPGPYTDRKLIYARETVLMAEYPPTVKVRLQAIRIGSLGIVSSPCETFCETGLYIKQHSPLKPTFVIELANGYNGYLPTPQQHSWGGYETWRARSSYLAVDAEPRIRATLLELLHEVAPRD